MEFSLQWIITALFVPAVIWLARQKDAAYQSFLAHLEQVAAECRSERTEAAELMRKEREEIAKERIAERNSYLMSIGALTAVIKDSASRDIEIEQKLSRLLELIKEE